MAVGWGTVAMEAVRLATVAAAAAAAAVARIHPS